ncbi:hypothetical protein FPQ18DRAFT_382503 [Pyronema domesticum]|nr:hypothetical protein FPQ18DRAFT_382503 [Pyronema domesticum]
MRIRDLERDTYFFHMSSQLPQISAGCVRMIHTAASCNFHIPLGKKALPPADDDLGPEQGRMDLTGDPRHPQWTSYPNPHCRAPSIPHGNTRFSRSRPFLACLSASADTALVGVAKFIRINHFYSTLLPPPDGTTEYARVREKKKEVENKKDEKEPILITPTI